MPTDKELLSKHQQGVSYQELARDYGLNVDSVRGRVWRASRGLDADPMLYSHYLGKPWSFDFDSFIVIGDVQLPTADAGFAALPLAIAEKYLKKPRRCIIAGDLINADAFSEYDSDIPTPTFDHEIQSARAFVSDYLSIFDEIYWILGNHERRVGKRTKGAVAPAHLLAMLTANARMQVSRWGHCVVKTPVGNWRVTHGSEYSVNALTVASELAHKYQQHIISHHEHHFGISYSRYKQYVIINNGGLFNQDDMSYVVLDDNKRPRMANGFTLIRRGFPTLFGRSPFTDWDAWITVKPAKRKAA